MRISINILINTFHIKVSLWSSNNFFIPSVNQASFRIRLSPAWSRLCAVCCECRSEPNEPSRYYSSRLCHTVRQRQHYTVISGSLDYSRVGAYPGIICNDVTPSNSYIHTYIPWNMLYRWRVYIYCSIRYVTLSTLPIHTRSLHLHH